MSRTMLSTVPSSRDSVWWMWTKHHLLNDERKRKPRQQKAIQPAQGVSRAAYVEAFHPHTVQTLCRDRGEFSGHFVFFLQLHIALFRDDLIDLTSFFSPAEVNVHFLCIYTVLLYFIFVLIVQHWKGMGRGGRVGKCHELSFSECSWTVHQHSAVIHLMQLWVQVATNMIGLF